MANNSNKSKKRQMLINGLGTVGHITRDNLERLGGIVDNMNAKGNKTSKYNAVDLNNFEAKSADNVFSQQTMKASQQLIGNRYATYGKYAKKVVPNSLFDKAVDTAFVQVAKLAASWSRIDLPNNQRFESIGELDDQERNALAHDIANQNRALAVLGGVTGLAGLPGMFADTLWLLLLSLRTVYQLATVYDKPLTGKQGVKMAYAVLSNADLSQMQEKQTILAGLGVASGLLENADNRGFRSELEKMGVGGSNASYYAEQVDKIAEQFNMNIDSMNLGWLTKFLPIVSVGVSSHYNHNLINEVIGVANATFGPEPKVAKEALTDQTKQQNIVSDVEKNSEDSDETSVDKNDDITAEVNTDSKLEKEVKDKAEDAKELVKDNLTDDDKTDTNEK